MSQLARKLNKPYYLFRPSQALRRTLLPWHMRRLEGDRDVIRLPWGHPLRFRVDDKIGICLARRGVFDLPVCEALWRLSDKGEVALDVGANIGQMTSVLSAAVGTGGRVIALEPHPDVFQQLSENASLWQTQADTARIELRNVGASSRSGTAELRVEEVFASNAGTASMVATDDGAAVEAITVPVVTLDEEIGDADVGVMKLDVEGYELEVLRGALRLLQMRRIRDIVFEEFDALPSPVTSLLESYGYTIFSLDQDLLGPVAGPPRDPGERKSTEDPSYLATTAPERALTRMRPRGWGALGVGAFARRRRPTA